MQKTEIIRPHCTSATRSMKSLRVAAQRRDDRQQQEDVDRDEDRVEPVPVDPDQVVLQRQHDEERDGERVVVAAPRRRQRDEFAQRRERGEARTARSPPACRTRRRAPISATITHHALMRPLRFSMVGVRPAARCGAASTKPTTERDDQHAPRRCRRTARRFAAWRSCVTAHARSPRAASASSALRLRSQERRLCPRRPRARVGAPKRDGAQQRDRHEFALRHDPVEVLDPHRHQLDVRPRPGEMIEPALERQQRAPPWCCACLRERGSASSPRRARPPSWRSDRCRGSAGSRSISTARKTRSPMKRRSRIRRSSSRRPRPAGSAAAGRAAAPSRSARNRRGSRGWRNRSAAADRARSRATRRARR